MSKKIGFLVAADPIIWKDYTDAFEDELTTKFHWNIGNGTGAKDVFIDYQPKDDATGAVVGVQGDSEAWRTTL